MSGWVEYQRMPENTMHIAYVQENGEVYLPEYGWKRAGSSALLENATPLIRMDAAEVGGRVAQALRDSGIAEQDVADLVGSILEAVFRDQ